MGAGNPNILYKACWVPVVHKQYLHEITENASCVESKPEDREGIYSLRLFVQQTIHVIPALEQEREENQGFRVKGIFISNEERIIRSYGLSGTQFPQLSNLTYQDDGQQDPSTDNRGAGWRLVRRKEQF